MMLEELSKQEQLTKIMAVDMFANTKSQKSLKRKEPLSTQSSSLPTGLTLCPQACVMLTNNIGASDGLTNGLWVL